MSDTLDTAYLKDLRKALPEMKELAATKEEKRKERARQSFENSLKRHDRRKKKD